MSNTMPAQDQHFASNTLRYEGYTGSIEFSQEDHVFFGKGTAD